MRESRTVQISIFDFYSQHEFGLHLKQLSELLDEYPEILRLLGQELLDEDCAEVGRKGLSVESIFRCMLLKQILGVSYKQLSFHLSDSLSYRTFARLAADDSPGKSSLQTNIRRISPQTLETIFNALSSKHVDQGDIDLSKIRIDSTVVKSNIAPPSDSQLLNDGVRVLSRLLAKSVSRTGIKIRFKDFRKASRLLSYRLFHAKKPEKEALYRELLPIAARVMEQVERATTTIRNQGASGLETQDWLAETGHFYTLMGRVIDQTRRRVMQHETVPAAEKIVSLFEEHTAIIIKGSRDIDYGHKINIASDARGLLTGVFIEDGNAADVARYLPVVRDHARRYGTVPETVVADGGYASLANLNAGKEMGIKRVVFHKKKGLTLTAMGVKNKTYRALRNFRAGIEGNISELKRAFGLDKSMWKRLDGFQAYVWASVLSYNLTRLARLRPG
jgi:IS5 family transposase